MATNKPKTELTKKEKISKKEKELMRIFKDIDENKKKFIKSQITELAWLIVSCTELREDVDKEGVVVEYQNGENQTGTKNNPKVNMLISYQKNINTIFKLLVDLVPNKPNKKSLLRQMLDDE